MVATYVYNHSKYISIKNANIVFRIHINFTITIDV